MVVKKIYGLKDLKEYIIIPGLILRNGAYIGNDCISIVNLFII